MTLSTQPTGNIPPPQYAMPPSSFKLPLWSKFLIGCGLLFLALLMLLGAGLARLTAGRRDGIQTQACLENLRAMHQGFKLYSQDYDDGLPQSAAWMDTTTPFVNTKTDFKCPIMRVTNPQGFGYAFNSTLSGAKTAKIASPEATALVYDSTNTQRNAADTVATLPIPGRHALLRTRAARNAPKHGNLILYVDGHIGYVGQDGTAVDVSRMQMRRALFAPPLKQKTK